MVVVVSILLFIALVCFLVLSYRYKNFHGDKEALTALEKTDFTEKKVTLENGTIINYGEGGLDKEECLVLIHGQGQAWKDYMEVLPRLITRYHVYSLDCHGHGESSHDKKRYKCTLIAEDVASFIETVIGKPVVISGHSSGGIIATAVAAEHKELVKGLLIEDSPFFCVEPKEMERKRAIVWFDSFRPLHFYLKEKNKPECRDAYLIEHGIMFSLFGKLQKKIVKGVTKYEKKHPGEAPRVWFMPMTILRGFYFSSSFDPEFAETFYDGSWFDGMTQEGILKAVDCPCTYIKAKTSFMYNSKLVAEVTDKERKQAYLCCANDDADAERVVSLVKDCRYVTTDTSDHLIHVRHIDTFAREAFRFIN